ncbi:MAG: FAD:protein FMN transferase [Candidatus Omnitrophota bacterium]
MKKKLFLLVTGCWLLVTGLSGCQNQPVCYKETRLLMGTFVEVVSWDKKAAPIVFNEIKRIEGLLSKYNPGSEVSKLNRFGKLTVSRDTLYILKKSGEFWQLSDGAFDITIAPVIDLWGFTDKQYYLPNEDEIKNTLTRVGFDKIIFNDRDNMVKFNLPGMKIDLGAIAKGYAVDCAISKLKENNITNCLINAGGNMYGLGTKFGKPWKIAIQNPRQKSFSGYIELMNNAVATSGDYEQYFMKDNRRYSHIFNPKTGYPADSKVVSATVIAPDGLTADALSTTIFVLGKEKAEVLLKKIPGVKTKIIEEDDVSHRKKRGIS